MFDGLVYSRKLRKYQRYYQRTAKAFKKDLDIARKEKKSGEEIYKIKEQEHYELMVLSDEISELQTRYLIRRAQRFFVPLPEYQEDGSDWEDSNIVGRILSVKGLSKLRSSIRAEQKERWEAWYRWIPLLASVTGVLGTGIGLLAALQKGGACGFH